MLNRNTEEGIDRLIKYVRRMNLLSDDQLKNVLNRAIINNPDSYMGLGIDIDGHINYIRNMSLFTDDQLRQILKKSADDPVMSEIFEDSTKKKALLDMHKMAKDIRGDPRKFARKVS